MNAYLLYDKFMEKDSASNGDFLQTAIREIAEMRKTKGNVLEGYYLSKSDENWPPADTKISDGILIWYFDPNGTARSFAISPTQRWKNEEGAIYLQWPSEDFRYYGRFDGEFLTEDHGDYQDYFFKAE